MIGFFFFFLQGMGQKWICGRRYDTSHMEYSHSSQIPASEYIIWHAHTQSDPNPWPLTCTLFCVHCQNMAIFSTATLGSVSGISFLSHIFTSDASYTPPPFPSLVNRCHKSPTKRNSFYTAKVSVSGNANTEVSEQAPATQLPDDSSALPEAGRQARVCFFITIVNAIVVLLSLGLWMRKFLCILGALQTPCGAFWKIIYVV